MFCVPAIEKFKGSLPGSGGIVGTGVLLDSFDISDPENIDSFERSVVGAYTGNGESAFQHEAAVDVLRSAHYVGSSPCVLLENIPTDCVLVAADDLAAVPGIETADYYWDDVPVTGSLLRYDYRSDAGGWIDNGTDTIVLGVALAAGAHTFSVRAVSTSGVLGTVATSNSFDVDPQPTPTWFDAVDIASCDSGDSSGGFVSIGQRVTVGATGSCTRIRVGQFSQITTAAIKVAVYSLDGLTLLGQGSVASQGPATGTWGEVFIDVPFPVTSGTEYRVAFSLSNVTWGFPGYVAAAAGVSQDFVNTYPSFPPATWTQPEFSAHTYAVGMGVV